MTICDLTHAYTPTSGGIRTYLDAKRRYILESTDHSHALVVPGEEDGIERGERWVTYRIKSPGIPGAAPYRAFSRPSALMGALAEIAPSVIELHTYYMPLEAWSAFRYRARAVGQAPVVSIFYHTDFAQAYAGHYTRASLGAYAGVLAEQIARRYVGGIVRRSDVAVTMSEQFGERLLQFGATRPALVPQGVDLETFHPQHADEELRRSFGLGPNDAMLAYAGRLDSEKHVDVLVRALDWLPAEPRFVLVIAGNGPLRPSLEARAASDPRLVVLPYLEKPDLACLLASADVYVTAGPHEVFAFSVVEAQACGLPTVGVAAGGLVSRVLPGLGFLGPVDDAEAFAQNVVRAWEARATIGPAARLHVERHYSWHDAFSSLLSHYAADNGHGGTAAGNGRRGAVGESGGPRLSVQAPAGATPTGEPMIHTMRET